MLSRLFSLRDFLAPGCACALPEALVRPFPVPRSPFPDSVTDFPPDLPHQMLSVFEAYQSQFRLITRRAAARFAARDWHGGQLDAVERLTLYKQFVGWSVADLRRSLGEVATSRPLWRGLRDAYAREARTGPTGNWPFRSSIPSRDRFCGW